MKLRILCLLLILTGCMQAAPSNTEVPTAVPDTATPTIRSFELTATQLIFMATNAPQVHQATATALAHQRDNELVAHQATSTLNPEEILFLPTPTGYDITQTAIAIQAQMTQTAKAIWNSTATPLPADCANVTDTYQELRLQVFIRAYDIGKPEHSIKTVSQVRCPADNWTLPFEYKIVILPEAHTDDSVIVAALEDIIRRLPDYPPENPDADNFVTVTIQRPDNNTISAGRFKYRDGISAYNAGIRRENLLQVLNIIQQFH